MVYDLIVIGGGPAGYLAAERAGEAGLNTLLIEKRFIGGVCLNEGCIPSKALLYSAKIFDGAAHGEKYGVSAEGLKLDHKFVVGRKNKVVSTLVGGIKSKLKKLKVTTVMEVATITGRTAEGFTVKAGDTEYTGAKLLIATGSVPVTPPIPGVKEGLESGFVLTNREILDLEEVPANLAVIGGGVIGLEMASYFNTAGSKVTVIEMMNKIAGPTDAEISEILLKNYQKKGVTFNLGCKVTGVQPGKVIYEADGKTFEVAADKVLLSIGRRAFTEGLGLETIGVETERGKIKTDNKGRTNIAGVYATGDVNGYSMLAHTAYRETEVAINDILGIKDTMRYNAIPSVIYTNPEVAGVGETEETAKNKGIDYEVVKLSMMYSGRYVAENEGGDGIIKVLINKKYRNVIGVHMIGNYSSEIIYGAGMMIETEMPINDIKQLVFPHPSVCEVIREGIFEFH
ncbi:MAG: dihydrolipoyl dehydrogenase [Ruminococcaceae bacterium]|nr:dihydrolipoyl dehydrogenase [Oscillospiraceae bacterium]